MVFRPVRQRVWEWIQTNTPGDTDPKGDKTDDILEEQAIKDPEKVRSLIARENARFGNPRLPQLKGTTKLRALALAGAICLIALMALAATMATVAGVMFVVNAAARLNLPWPPVGTSTLTLAGASVAGVTAWRVGHAVLRRRMARASAENPPESRTKDDQNPVGAP
ncbi:hypothetical protein [Streptomyces sp. SAS_276]|uniref:hypothetical protein n=1 Tax=Streptomyces sp. SAS_276 TaxID=3412745 RepID=UPI00403CFEB2